MNNTKYFISFGGTGDRKIVKTIKNFIFFNYLDNLCDNCESTQNRILFYIKDDGIRVRRMRSDFFANIERRYGYHDYMTKTLNQLQNYKNRNLCEYVECWNIDQFNFMELHNLIQVYRNDFIKNIEYLLQTILEKSIRSKEVHLKPLRTCILGLLFQKRESTLIIKQRIFKIRWREIFNQERTRWVKKIDNGTSIYQRICSRIERYMENRTYPREIICYQ